MRRSTIVAAAGLLMLLMFPALVGYSLVRSKQINATFEKVVIGDVERDIVAKMGRPHRILEDCDYYGMSKVGCARLYVYYPPWSFAEESWAIALNENGAVIYTAYFVSP